jgi:D-alanine-D-alanine ligase
MKKIRVGLCFNLIQDFPKSADDAEDIDAEWTDEKDVETIYHGLVEAGFDVVRIGDPINLIRKRAKDELDVVFSIAEMQGFRYRESIAPAICDLLKIPYTFSPPDVMVLALDKHVSNLMVKYIKIPVPEWFVVRDISDMEALDLRHFPDIIKPVAEGSSIGISNQSIIYTKGQAVSKGRETLLLYKQPVMVQRFVQGREITIGVIEDNQEITALEPILVMDNLAGETKVNDVHSKKRAKESPPSKIEDKQVVQKIKDYAQQIFKEFSCRSTARIDFRQDKNGVIYFMEINPLTDYTPRKDFCKSALAAGYSYPEILNTIVLNAIKNGKERK